MINISSFQQFLEVFVSVSASFFFLQELINLGEKNIPSSVLKCQHHPALFVSGLALAMTSCVRRWSYVMTTAKNYGQTSVSRLLGYNFCAKSVKCHFDKEKLRYTVWLDRLSCECNRVEITWIRIAPNSEKRRYKLTTLSIGASITTFILLKYFHLITPLEYLWAKATHWLAHSASRDMSYIINSQWQPLSLGICLRGKFI
jgi:hypothetical protein